MVLFVAAVAGADWARRGARREARAAGSARGRGSLSRLVVHGAIIHDLHWRCHGCFLIPVTGNGSWPSGPPGRPSFRVSGPAVREISDGRSRADISRHPRDLTKTVSFDSGCRPSTTSK